MRLTILIGFLVYFNCAQDAQAQDEETATTISSILNSTLDDIIRQASIEDNEVFKSYTPADFLFNSCGMEEYKPTEEFRKLFPYYLSGFDGEGRPIWVCEFGKFDLTTVTSRGQSGIDDIETYAKDVIFNLIRSLFLKPTPGRPTFQFSFIVDLEGLPIEQITIENVQLVKKLAKQYLRMVDEYSYVLLLVNGNSIAEKLTKIFKPIFEDSMDKIEAFTTDKSQWLPFTKKLFPADQIAPWYGGNGHFKPFRVYP